MTEERVIANERLCPGSFRSVSECPDYDNWRKQSTCPGCGRTVSWNWQGVKGYVIPGHGS